MNQKNMVMHTPLHPGLIVKDVLFNDTDLTISGAAQKLGIDRTTLSRLVNGHIGISPEMAMRLSLFLGSSPELWMNLQRDYDLWQMNLKRDEFDIVPFTSQK